MGSSQLKAAKLLQYEEDDSGAKAAAAAKGGAEDEEEEESGQSLEASNEQDGRVPGQHDEEDEQGWMDGGISSCWYFF